MPNDTLGLHLLADFHGVTPALLADPERLEAMLREAADAAGATPIMGHFHHFGSGQGVTGVLLLRESHISIHTWPEHGFAALDVFMCGAARPAQAIQVLRERLRPASVTLTTAERGARQVAPTAASS